MAKAKGYCFQALTLARDKGALQWQLLSLIGFGLVAIMGGQPQRGARLFAAADSLLAQHGIKVGTIGLADIIWKQTLEKAQAQLGPAFQAAWAEGQQMTIEQALALATEEEIDAK